MADVRLQESDSAYRIAFNRPGAKIDMQEQRLHDNQVRVLPNPSGLNAHVTFNGALSNIQTTGAWQQEGDEYLLSGSGLALWITLNMGAGDVELREIK